MGGCLISVKQLRYIPRIKGTEAYIVCAIVIALSILWEMQFRKKENSWINWIWTRGGKEGEGIRLPDLYDKCTCWRVISCEEKVGPEVGSPRFCKTTGVSDDSFEFCIVKVSYGLYHLKQKIIDGSSCMQNEKNSQNTKISKSHFLQFSGSWFHCDSWMSFKDLDFLLGSVVTFLKQ